MSAILLRATFFLMLVVLGYVIKKCGVLTKADGVSVSRVVLYITLPAAILVGFNSFDFSWLFMIIPLLGFLGNWIMLGIGYVITRGKSRDSRIFYMLELPAYNIGNFTLPFVSGILGPSGVIGTCLFDMGNAPMCLGVNLTMTEMALKEKSGTKLWKKLLSVLTKPAFTIYLIMLILSAFHIRMPKVIVDFASLISPANAPLAMIMIGLMLEFNLDMTRLKEALSVNVIRLAIAALIGFSFFFFAPFDFEIRKAVAITAFAPISSSSPAFVADLKGDIELVGFASTISIIISLILMPLLLVLL